MHKKTLKVVAKKTAIQIVCTTSMLADAATIIGGKHAAVVGLMGSGIDPHMYRASEGDVHKLANADIIFYNGLYLEGKMCDILQKMNRYTKSVSVADVIEKNFLITSDFETIYDPHVWHDVQLWIKIVTHIRDTVVAYDPTHTDFYYQNAQEYLEQLVKLDAYVKKQASRITKSERILVTAHDAFSYFGRAYGFNVVGLQGISTDAQVGTKDVAKLASYIVKNKVHAVFIESSVPFRNIEVVQHAVQARGWHVAIGDELFSDALGDYNSSAGTYVGMIRHNIDAIVTGLAGQQKEN